jgi:putative ABC transport system ATP-binding protein
MTASAAFASPPVRPLLAARNIVKTITTAAGDLHILKGVSMDLRPGELTLLMGPSGSGKTTLLSILGCILTASSGELKIAGEEAVGKPAEGLADIRRRHVGFVFQGYNLFPTLTAVENVMVALDVRGALTRDPQQASIDALKAVGLSHRLNTYPSKLSGGEKQRVAIARSLAGRPSVILADEPTAALDSENGKAVMELLQSVARDPTRAVLAVTHDHRTLPYADRIIRIEDGLIVADERPVHGAPPNPGGHAAAAAAAH